MPIPSRGWAKTPSSTMFKMRELLLRKKQKELSEYKTMYIIKDYFSIFH
ncbi:Mobile element protein [Bacillus mycoides]|nr:Mobile element protein [Bacillus mycoides]